MATFEIKSDINLSQDRDGHLFGVMRVKAALQAAHLRLLDQDDFDKVMLHPDEDHGTEPMRMKISI